MADVTQLIDALQRGEKHAADELLPLVYDELRRLASLRLRGEPHDVQLQATGLVHEAYLRLIAPPQSAAWEGRGHFFAAAAEAMRRILVDTARQRKSLKRGGDWHRDEFDASRISAPEPEFDLLALDEALEQFSAIDPDGCRLVKLRCFAGLTMEEAASVLGISPRTAARQWTYARAWLHDRLAETG